MELFSIRIQRTFQLVSTIQSEDFPKFLQNARDTMGGLFTLDPRPITDEEILHIFKKSYK